MIPFSFNFIFSCLHFFFCSYPLRTKKMVAWSLWPILFLFKIIFIIFCLFHRNKSTYSYKYIHDTHFEKRSRIENIVFAFSLCFCFLYVFIKRTTNEQKNFVSHVSFGALMYFVCFFWISFPDYFFVWSSFDSLLFWMHGTQCKFNQ